MSDGLPNGLSGLPDASLSDEDRLLDELVLQYWEQFGKTRDWTGFDFAKIRAATEILRADAERRLTIFEVLVPRLIAAEETAYRYRNEARRMDVDGEWKRFWGPVRLLLSLTAQLWEQKLPLNERTYRSLFAWGLKTRSSGDVINQNVGWLVEAAEGLAQLGKLDAELIGALLPVCGAFQAHLVDLKKYGMPKRPVLLERLEKLVASKTILPLDTGEAWAEAALSGISEGKQTWWREIFLHCREATAANPTPKWLERATELLSSEDDWVEFKDKVLVWFPLVAKPRTAKSQWFENLPIGHWTIVGGHAAMLRGLAWICGLRADEELARALGQLAVIAYKQDTPTGPRAVAVGNACLVALKMMPGIMPVAQLAVVKAKAKFGTAQIAVAKALTAVAEREGVSAEELEEMSVPTYGLSDVGRMMETLGEFTAELKVVGTKSAEIIWRRADGKVQKSLPAAVKKEFAEPLKELNATKKDLEKMLPAQAERMESLFLQQRTWPLETWRERYLDHPLVGTLARRLIWNFTTDGQTTPGIWLDGQLVDHFGERLTLDAKHTAVGLWHPLGEAPQVVHRWRAFLEERQIAQPCKQAHREIYILTPAEEQTREYSNRFAAHILKQHQFNALCHARGWKNQLRLAVSNTSYAPPARLLPHWKLRAEFWVEGAAQEGANETGTYLYVATDQVRFYAEDASQVRADSTGGGYGASLRHPVVAPPIALADIPPLVFSEIMRDVDLFVGVASVGNDPAWMDGGRNEVARNAWERASFGDLSAPAQTRRDLLERLVPKLKIADRCSFEDRFLVVRGDLRTYKIHLGSGNILMAPNDQYLCIVPNSSMEEGKVFLPFEGDRTLSVILSKAFLLTADAKITDSSITRQIRLV